jgi:hypothetical protein
MLQKTFSLSDDEIVRGESFSHANEPMLTFNPIRSLVYVNAACLKRIPNMDYALFVISPIEKRLSIYPCGANELNSVRLRSGGTNHNKPRQVRFYDDFSDKMLALMQWSRDCRYRLIGYTATGGSDTIIAFDLSSAEVFYPADGAVKTPEQLHKGFGSVFVEQQNNPLIRMVEQDAEVILSETEGESVNEL